MKIQRFKRQNKRNCWKETILQCMSRKFWDNTPCFRAQLMLIIIKVLIVGFCKWRQEAITVHSVDASIARWVFFVAARFCTGIGTVFNTFKLVLLQLNLNLCKKHLESNCIVELSREICTLKLLTQVTLNLCESYHK